MRKKAFITGINGQDGSYLAEFLLQKNYEVHGSVRRVSNPNLERIEHILDKITVHSADLADTSSLIRVIGKVEPDEVYNLAGQSFVATSWEIPIATADLTALGVSRVLEAIRIVNPKIRFYQASSSEMFGTATEIPQTEDTRFYPRSPYGVAKVFGHWLTVNYRESFNIFACSGILFNHESPRRGLEFVTRKISNGVARIKLGLDKKLELGNLSAQRDWGFAGDYVQAMWLMLQQEKPRDYVIATGETHSVEEFCKLAFARVGLDYKEHVVASEKFMRPAEIDILLGSPAKAVRDLGWSIKTNFGQLVDLMVDSDLEKWKRLAVR